MSHQDEGKAGSDEVSDMVMRILIGLNSDRKSAAKHMQETPVRVLGGRTIAKALSDGDADKVLRYLQSIGGGQNG